MVLVGVFLASLAPANTISQTQGFRLNSENAAASLGYDPFNVSLGTLQGIDISFAANRRHAWGIWNISDDAGSVPYDVTLQDTTLTLDGNIFGFVDLHYGPGTTPVLNPALGDFAGEFAAGSTAFLAGLDPVFASAYQPATNVTSIFGNFLPSLAFTGTLDLAYAYNPGIFHIESDNFLSGSLVDVYGTATVTYTYAPVALVPDSPLGPSVAVLWFGLMAAARVARGKRLPG